jgi:cyanophycinase
MKRRVSKPREVARRLVIIGGAEDKKAECRILREFVRLAGGRASRIVVMTVASEHPAEVGEEYLQTFVRLGAGKAEILEVSSREDATGTGPMETVEKATAVFFTGGDQLRIMNLLGGTAIDTALHRRCDEGMILGGTSAGASIMSSMMVVGRDRHDRAQLNPFMTSPGMEFLPGVLIDQHFEQRGRIKRLLAVVAQFPHNLGIGIDEDTALFVENQQFEVMGEGKVTVIDAGSVSFNNALDLGKGVPLALCGLKLHILPHGFRFDLRNRRPVLNKREAGAGRKKRGTHQVSDHED